MLEEAARALVDALYLGGGYDEFEINEDHSSSVTVVLPVPDVQNLEVKLEKIIRAVAETYEVEIRVRHDHKRHFITIRRQAKKGFLGRLF